MRDVAPADLALRGGCSILLERAADDSFEGATTGTGCASSLRGAAYATTEVVVRHDRFTSWDRGWNTAGEQVWGAVKGPYAFVKRGAAPPPPYLKGLGPDRAPGPSRAPLLTEGQAGSGPG
jgi:hypothetical protein